LFYILRFILIIGCTIVMGSLACLIGLVDRSGEAVVWVARVWAVMVLWSSGVRVEASGRDRVRPGAPYLFMSNHQSLIDIVVIVSTIPVSFRFVAKKELAKIPFFGWAMKVGGHVFIDRQNREQAIEDLKLAGQRVRDGMSVILFPEGTRSLTGELAPFKHGPFHLALAAGVPVIPLSISGTRHILRKKSLRIEPGSVKIVYGTPILTKGDTPDDRVRLMEEVRAAILEGMDPTLRRLDRVS